MNPVDQFLSYRFVRNTFLAIIALGYIGSASVLIGNCGKNLATPKPEIEDTLKTIEYSKRPIFYDTNGDGCYEVLVDPIYGRTLLPNISKEAAEEMYKNTSPIFVTDAGKGDGNENE